MSLHLQQSVLSVIETVAIRNQSACLFFDQASLVIVVGPAILTIFKVTLLQFVALQVELEGYRV